MSSDLATLVVLLQFECLTWLFFAETFVIFCWDILVKETFRSFAHNCIKTRRSSVH